LTRVPANFDHPDTMATPPSKIVGLDALSVPERLLLFCVASGTDPAKAKITHRTIELLMIKNLIRHDDGGLVLTDLGRAILDALLSGRK
jgi:hypothetical protein